MNKNREVTGALFFIALLATIILGIWLPILTIIVFIAITVIIALELSHALKKQFKPFSYVSVILGALTSLSPLLIWLSYRNLGNWFILSKDSLPLSENAIASMIWLLAFSLLTFVLFFFIYAMANTSYKIIKSGPKIFPHAVAESAAAFYIALPTASVYLFLFTVPRGLLWLLFAILSPMIIDVSAYYVGTRFGKKKMIPQISPHKSWIGFGAGIVASVLFSIAFFSIFLRGDFPFFMGGKNFFFAILSGLVIGGVAQVGDWLASALKRWCEIKDFSNLLPGHGGLLDRFDSMFYSLPSTLILAILYFLMKR